MSEENDQKRKAVRVALSVSLKVTWLDSANTTFSENMRTHNVSKIGAFLITTRTLPIGTVLKLETMNKRNTNSEEVLAKVVSLGSKKKIAGIGIKIIKGQDAWKEIITSL